MSGHTKDRLPSLATMIVLALTGWRFFVLLTGPRPRGAWSVFSTEELTLIVILIAAFGVGDLVAGRRQEYRTMTQIYRLLTTLDERTTRWRNNDRQRDQVTMKTLLALDAKLGLELNPVPPPTERIQRLIDE